MPSAEELVSIKCTEELGDGLSVPVERIAHVELLSFTIPGYALGTGCWKARLPFPAIRP